MFKNDNQSLIEYIEASFAHIVYPGDDNLFGEIWDPDIPEWCAILRGKHWKDTLSILEEWAALSKINFYDGMYIFMNIDAIYYFTPAFLIISLDERSDTFGDNFFHLFDPVWRLGRGNDESYTELLQLLTIPQMQAIAMAYRSNPFRSEETALNDHFTKWLVA